MTASDCLHEQFLQQAGRSPAATAVVCGEQTLTYAELAAISAHVAARLQSDGVSVGDCVAVEATQSVRFPALLLGILRAGAAWLPLGDDWPEARRRQVLDAARPACIIDDEFYACTDAAPAIPADVAVAADDNCYIMFTSGSTGEPSGVVVSHGSVAGLFSNLPDALRPAAGDTWSALHAPTFGFSVWELFGPLVSGGTVCIIAAGERRDPQQWNGRLATAAVTTLSLTPSGLQQWLAAGCTLPPSVERIVLSGEPVGSALLTQWFAGPASHRVRLLSTYALTETAGRIAWAELTGPGDAGLLGVPVADAELRLFDPETLQVPDADGLQNEAPTGELFVAGPMLASGYLNDALLTGQRFSEFDPDGSGLRRWYRTGDRAQQRPDGALVFTGRSDNQLKIRGHRIEAAAIEQALEAHPGVAAAAVVAGDAQDPQLFAFVTPAAQDEPVEFWPSLGEYQIYDALLYDFMSADETRVAAYRQAFVEQVAGKIALDIGTGKDAVLARLCAQAGARHVYAVEVLEEAAASAQQLVSDLGLDDRITMICGDMDSVELPEAIELCTQGIIGNIGSSDGIVPIWNGAQRFFSKDFTAVPEVCTTLIAPVRLPESVRSRPAFTPLAADYTRRVFAAEGREFDVRLCVRNFPADALLAEPAEFEQLDFRGELSADYSGTAEFVIDEAGWFDGYVLWTRITTTASAQVDFLEHQQAWLPVFFPLGDAAVRLGAGARIAVNWSCMTPGGQNFPDYQVVTTLHDGDETRTLSYCSRHHETALGETALHRALHASLSETQPDALRPQALLAWLAERLPGYMLPDQVRIAPALPLTASRKLDRRALAALASTAPVMPAAEQESADELEAAILQIWTEVLGRPVGLAEDFFSAGGDSISAVRLTTEVQRYLDDAVFLAALYEAPDVRSYAAWLREHHGDAVSAVISAGDCDDAIAPAADGPLPLAWAQQSLWFLDQLYPGNTAANEQFVIRIHGVAEQRVVSAWAELVAAHDVLRTTFAGNGTAAAPLQQYVAPAASEAGLNAASLAAVFDYRSTGDAEGDLQRLAAREIATAFDLATGPLLRPVLVHMSATESALLVTAHHTVADGLCVPLIQQALYDACTGTGIAAPALQFGDFASWQRGRMTGDKLEAELGWWRQRLDGATVEPVPATQPRASADGPETRIPFVINREVAAALRAFARAEGVSLYVVLLSLWRVWLARCFERDDFLVGSPATQRTTTQTATMLGCMVNNIALRNPLAGRQGLRDVVRSEHQGLLAALDHSTVPFEKIVEDLEPERVFARHPLFQFMFQFEERPAPLDGPGGERFAVDVLPVDRASYWDMELSVTDAGSDTALCAFLGVRNDLFDAAACAEWSEGFVAMLQAALAEPDEPVSRLPLLGDAQQSARARRNATDYALPADSLYTAIAQQASRDRSATAVRVGGERYTYGELLEQTARYSRALHASGVGPDAVVGVAMSRSFTTIALLLAINSRGAVWMALDPDYPAVRLRHMLNDVVPQLVVHADPELDEGVSGLLHDAGVPLVSATELAGRAHGVRDMQVLPPPADACILFTSGSTGLPKGMRQAHDAVLGRCLWMWEAEGFRRDDVFAHRTSLNFVDAMWEMFGPLLHGAIVDIVPPESQRDFEAQSRFVTEREISHVLVFPSALSVMLEKWAGERPHSLHTVIVTGEPVSAALVERFADVLPDCRLLNTYGTSENWDVCRARLDGRVTAGPVPAGMPVANTRVYILDNELQALPAGVTGDLYVAGAGVGEGYINRPELTAERFVAHPSLEGEALFRTGDRAAFNTSGEVVLQGRADRQLKLRGVRIEPGEIEALANARPDVRESAVVLHGEEAKTAWLTLYVVGDAEPDVSGLRQYLAERLPSAAVPADIVRLEALPYTPSGKIDAAAFAPASNAGAEIVAPATSTEAALLAIWEQALGRTGISTHDDFFALRGNSLLATQVIARVCDEFVLDLPLASLFEQPTVAGLAGIIDALRWTAGDDGAGDDDADREVVQL